MNGLEYIRIRCNLSQSFLAQKLGVTRQTIDLWESRTTPLPKKRLAQLVDFFGVDEKYFGEITEEQGREIDRQPAFPHEEDGHLFYSYRKHPESAKSPHEDQISHLLVPPEGSPLVSIDERYAMARQQMKELLSDIESLVGASKHEKNTLELILSINRVVAVFTPLVDTYRHFMTDCSIHPSHRMLHFYTAREIEIALGIAYGAIDPEALEDDDPTDPDGNYWPYGIHPSFVKKLVDEIGAHMDHKKAFYSK